MVEISVPAGESEPRYTFRDAVKDARNGFNILIFQAIAVVTVFMAYMANTYYICNDVLLHVILCSIGYIFLISSGIFFYAGDNIFARPIARHDKYILHGIITFTGAILSVLGVTIEIYNKMDDLPHFRSAHAITGSISLILLPISCCVLLGGTLKPGAHRNIFLFHNFMGLTAYVVGMISFCLGFDTWWFYTYGTVQQKVAMIILTTIITIYVIIHPLKSVVEYFLTKTV